MNDRQFWIDQCKELAIALRFYLWRSNLQPFVDIDGTLNIGITKRAQDAHDRYDKALSDQLQSIKESSGE